MNENDKQPFGFFQAHVHPCTVGTAQNGERALLVVTKLSSKSSDVYYWRPLVLYTCKPTSLQTSESDLPVASAMGTARVAKCH